jgi:hypothetical protein
MAISYESAGQQVTLSGSQTAPSFQPRQVAVTPFDPSRQMLQQSETDLSAFAKFSETLNAFLKTKGEEKIKQEKARGFSKFLDGKVAASPKTISQFQVNKAAVDAGAAADLAVANAAKDDPTKTGVAATIVAGSPALRGWEAVGYAEAQVQAAPADLENYLSSNRRSTKPIQLEDGRVIAPIDATGTDISLVIKALREQWFTQSGISNINPVLIQANGGYNIAMAERQVMSNWQKEDDANSLKDLQYNTQNQVANGLPIVYKSPEDANQWVQNSYRRLRSAFGSGSEANAKMLETIGNELKLLATNNKASEMETLLNNTGSSMIEGLNMTFRGRNEAQFREFDTLIAKTREGQAAAINDSEKAGLDDLKSGFETVRQNGTPAQVRAARNTYEAALMNSASPYAMQLRNDLDSQDSSLKLFTNIQQQILAGNKGPGGRPLWTQTDVTKLGLAGAGGLEADQVKTLNALLPEEKSFVDRFKFIAPNVKNLATGQLTASLGKVGATYGIDRGFTARLDGAIDLAIRLSADALEKRYGDNPPSEDQMRRDLLLEVKRRTSAKTEEVYIDPKTGNMPNLEAGTKGLPAGKTPAPEPVLSDAEVSRLTAKAGVLPTTSPVFKRIDPTNYDLYQKIITEGGNLPADAMALVQMTGLSPDAWMKAQGKYYTPFVPNPDKEKAFQRNYAIDPSAANILRNPRSTRMQIQSAIERLRNGGRPAAETGPTNNAFSGAGNFGGLPKLLSGGEGGFNSVNLGTTYSGKQMNLTSMTIGEVEKLQSSGQMFAAGFAQWIPGNLTKARVAANLASTAKMTPENQLKMFWSYVLKTDKRPILRDYLLGKNNDLDGAQNDLANEWAAVKNTSGVGSYDNDKAGNKATIDQAATRRSLLNARREIMANPDVILKSLE